MKPSTQQRVGKCSEHAIFMSCDHENFACDSCCDCGADTYMNGKLVKKGKQSPPPNRDKTLKDFEPMYACRFHPTDWFHEVGCPHMKWTKAQLQKALDDAKRSNAYSFYLRDKSL